jgi:4-nitrophenyl phosphatase
MKTYLIDLDGTMYHGTAPIKGAREWIEQLHQQKIPYYFLTNNASRTPEENAKHMRDMGFNHISAEHFFNSAMAAVLYVKRHYKPGKVFMIGMNGLKEELIKHGFELVDHHADYVFVGMNRQADYALYSQALVNLVDGATLVGTNSDRILLSEQGVKIGNGSVVKMLEYASGQTSIPLGKPHLPFMEEAFNYLNLQPSDVVMVGDNLETDILCGINAHVQTILVTQGVHQETDIIRLGIYPDRVVEYLTDI